MLIRLPSFPLIFDTFTSSGLRCFIDLVKACIYVVPICAWSTLISPSFPVRLINPRGAGLKFKLFALFYMKAMVAESLHPFGSIEYLFKVRKSHFIKSLQVKSSLKLSIPFIVFVVVIESINAHVSISFFLYVLDSTITEIK